MITINFLFKLSFPFSSLHSLQFSLCLCSELSLSLSLIFSLPYCDGSSIIFFLFALSQYVHFHFLRHCHFFICDLPHLTSQVKMENGLKFQEVSNTKYDCLLFDVDDTLYPLSSGISAQTAKNIQEYMLQNLGMEAAEVPELCYSLYKTYGTTMAGLRAIGYEFDYDDFHSFVHGRLQYNVLKPDPVLRGILQSLPIRKVIFTNADTGHAIRVLQSLGLDDCFESIISFDTLNSFNNNHPLDDQNKSEMRPTKTEIFDFSEYMRSTDSNILLPTTPIVCKPFEDAFGKAFDLANIDPQRTLFFDDSIRNLVTAKGLGLHTVMVGTSMRSTGVDHVLESIHNIREAFPELWENDEKHEIVKYKFAIETSVKA